MRTLLLFGAIALSVNLFAQNINIPDVNFKTYLVDDLAINVNGDDEIQLSEAVAYTGLIDCVNLLISDLTGIEEFTGLTELRCGNNLLTNLDVTQNTALFSLDCWNNQLTSLDVTQNTALTYLSIRENQLTSLDVSQNTLLGFLECYNNELTSLDLTQNIALFTFFGNFNQLTCLNLKNGNNTLIDGFLMRTSGNPELTCIEVDDVAWATANWTIIDAQTTFSASCANSCALGLEEYAIAPKHLLKIVDLMGRETQYKPNTPLIYVYSDGTTEKVFKMD